MQPTALVIFNFRGLPRIGLLRTVAIVYPKILRVSLPILVISVNNCFKT